MTRSARYLFNAFVCLLVAAHAVYWYATGRLDDATTLRVALWVGQLALGCIGVAWFLRRASLSRARGSGA